MLSVEDIPGNGLESSPAADDDWANFQSAEAISGVANDSIAGAVESKKKSASGDEELFDDSPPVTTLPNNAITGAAASKEKSASGVEELLQDSPTPRTQPLTPEKSQENVKIDIMSLFDKSNMVSPFAIHQHQLAYLSHQQALLMAAAKSSNGAPPLSGSMTDQLDANAFKVSNGFPAQSWANITQVPGTLTNAGQQYGNIIQAGNFNVVPQSGINFGALLTSGVHNVGAEPKVVSSRNSVSSSPSTTPNQSLGDYDFSSLTQGMFSKR